MYTCILANLQYTYMICIQKMTMYACIHLIYHDSMSRLAEKFFHLWENWAQVGPYDGAHLPFGNPKNPLVIVEFAMSRRRQIPHNMYMCRYIMVYICHYLCICVYLNIYIYNTHIHTHDFVSIWVPSGRTGGIWHHQRCLGARDEQWRLGALLGWGQPQCRLCRGLFDNAVSWRCWERRHWLGLKNYLGLSESAGNTKKNPWPFFWMGTMLTRGFWSILFSEPPGLLGIVIAHEHTYLPTSGDLANPDGYLTAVKSGCNLWYTKYFPGPLFQHALNMSAYVYVYVRI